MAVRQPKRVTAAQRGGRAEAAKVAKRAWRAKPTAEGAPAPEEDCASDVTSTAAGDGTPPASCPGTPKSTSDAASRSPAGQSPAKGPRVERGAREQAAAAAEPSPTADAPAEPSDTALVERGLARLLTEMSKTTPASTRKTAFDCKFAPGISVGDYVARVLRFSQCGPECVVISLVYLDRLIKRRPWIAVTPLSCHRLVLTTIVLAIKFYDDTYYSNKFYSQIGGVKLQELNSLEKTFLQLIDYKLCVDPQEHDMYRDILLKTVQLDVQP